MLEITASRPGRLALGTLAVPTFQPLTIKESDLSTRKFDRAVADAYWYHDAIAMRLLRRTIAVFVGYMIFAVSAGLLFKLSGHNPHATASLMFMIISTVYGMVFAALGGFVATKLSGSAQAVGALIALGAAASLVMSPSTDAKWSQLSAILFMAPSAVFGGALLVRKFAK